MDGDIVIDTKNYQKDHFGVYQAETNTVKLFNDTKRNEQFFRYPSSLR